jgi:hypothetical protein
VDRHQLAPARRCGRGDEGRITTITADTNVAAATADINGAAVTWTPDPARVYVTTAYVGRAVQVTTGGEATFILADGAGNQPAGTPRWSQWMPIANATASPFLQIRETGLPAVLTVRKLRGQVSGGSLTVQGAFRGYVRVDDMGVPAPRPAQGRRVADDADAPDPEPQPV